MKKTFLYTGVLLSMLSVASCDDSFGDWASLKTNEAPTAAEAYGLNFTGSGIDIDMNAENNPDSIDIVTVTSTSDVIGNVVVKSVTVNGGVLPYSIIDGTKVRVGVAAIDSIAKVTLKSQKYEKRVLPVVVEAAGVLKDGSAVAVSGSVTQNETPVRTPDVDAKGYYMLGNINGNDWTVNKPVMMKETAEGSHVYKASVTTVGDTNWFKFYGASTLKGVDGSATTWDDANSAQFGCVKNGDDAMFNYVLWGDDVQTPVIAGRGSWIVTFDANTWTYSISKPVLYMAGDANGWKQSEMLISSDGVSYTGFMYLNNNGFKFSTQQDRDGTNYGEGFSTAADAANISLPSGYEPGYYQVTVNLEAKTMDLTAITTIGIIGDATVVGWDSDMDMTYNSTEHTWELLNVSLKVGELKFRANDDWVINWGGTEDNLTQGGSNIKIADEGTYDIVLHALADGQATCTITKR